MISFSQAKRGTIYIQYVRRKKTYQFQSPSNPWLNEIKGISLVGNHLAHPLRANDPLQLHPIFYKEIAGGYLQKSEQSMLLEPGQGVVKVMFSKYDVMKLERIVGTQRVGKMITDQGDTFDFV